MSYENEGKRSLRILKISEIFLQVLGDDILADAHPTEDLNKIVALDESITIYAFKYEISLKL